MCKPKQTIILKISHHLYLSCKKTIMVYEVQWDQKLKNTNYQLVQGNFIKYKIEISINGQGSYTRIKR